MSFVFVICLIEAAIIPFVFGDSTTATLFVDVPKDGSVGVAELIRAATMQGISVTPQRSLTDDIAEEVSDAQVVYKMEPAVVVGTDSAYVDCPCIDHVKNATWAARIASQVSHDTLTVGDTEYPRDYGSAVCKGWDSRAERGKCLGNRELCQRKWCWVDDESCGRPDLTRSKDFPGLAFSYSTCGNTGLMRAVRDYAPILPFFSADMLPQNIWSRAGPGHLKGGAEVPQKQKYVAALASRMLKELKLPTAEVTYRPISNESLGKWGSVYSACVHDVAIGNLDLCAGDLWFTRERSSIRGAMFVPIASEALRLIMPRVSKGQSGIRSLGDWWGAMAVAFEPFSPGLWTSIIVLLVSTSAILYFVERRAHEKLGIGEFGLPDAGEFCVVWSQF